MNDHLKLYDIYRAHLTEINRAAVSWGMAHKPELLRTAKKLHLLGAGDTLAFKNESDMTILMDALIYEAQLQQQKIIIRFLAQYELRDEVDRELADSIRRARLGLYRIAAVRPECGELELTALIADDANATLTNIALAESAAPGMIIAMRILRLPEISILSGAFFPFAADKEQRMVRVWWKQQGLERYAHLFRLSRKETFQPEFV